MAATLHTLKRFAFTEQAFPLFLYISHPTFCIFPTPTFCIFLRSDSALTLASTQFFAIATHSTILGAHESPTFCIFLWSIIPLTPCKYSIFAQIPPRARPSIETAATRARSKPLLLFVLPPLFVYFSPLESVKPLQILAFERHRSAGIPCNQASTREAPPPHPLFVYFSLLEPSKPLQTLAF